MLSPLLKKLLFVRQFSVADGKISILGKRHVMLPDDALLELQNIDNSRLYDIVKDATFKQLAEFIEHAAVYKQLKEVMLLDILALSKKLGAGEEGALRTLQDVFDVYGLGKLVIIDLDNTRKRVSARVYESSIAQAWLAKNKTKSKTATCTLTAAVLAGIFSYLFKKSVDCVEGKCLAKGNSCCEFLIK